jgi:hypothetical protein
MGAMHSAAQCLLALVAVDLFVAHVHWLNDTYDTGDYTLRWHHKAQQDTQRKSFLGWAGHAATAYAWLLLLPIPVLWLCGAKWGYAFWLAAYACACLPIAVHMMCHRAQQPAWYRALTATGLLHTREQHVRWHHAANARASYAPLLPPLNRLLDATGYWRALEWCVLMTLGRPPVSDAELRHKIAALGQSNAQ